MLLEKIENLKAQIANLKADNSEALEALRIKYLSKKGEVAALFGEFRNVPNDQKREFGQRLNELKTLATDKINSLKENFKEKEASASEIDIFARQGFTLADGPEVEDDLHVFTSLNFAPDHPARDMQDTFFISEDKSGDVTRNIVLRSHTSSVQSRVMKSTQPPIRIICPGRVYRG